MAERKVSPLTEYMFYKAGRLGNPLSGTFELTPMCNFSCRMCYVRKTAEQVRGSERPMRTLDQWLSLAKEARDAGMLYLLLTGGEPMIWSGFWELYEELSEMGLVVSINTNGSMLTDDAVRKLEMHPPRRVNITMYGANDSTYENLCRVRNMFSVVDHSIMKLKEAGIQVKLNCSLTPYNTGDLEDMVVYAKKRELILDIATYMFPPLRRNEAMVGRNERFTPEESAYYRLKAYRLQYDEEQYEKYLEMIQKGNAPAEGADESCIDPVDGKIRCRAGKASFWATWDGWLTPCGMMTEPKVDLAGRSFPEAWKELKEVSGRVAVSGICSKCSGLQICHSCAAMAQTETGTFSGIPSYLCATVREMKRLAEEERTEKKTSDK